MSDTASGEPSPKREYPEVSSNALAVLQKRYFLKDRIDHPTEDVEGFFNRVVRGVVDVELERGWVDKSGHAELVDSMYGLVRGLRFIPNSPCLMNSGKPGGYAQMAACFVLPIDDDLRSIKTTDMNAAIIHQSGGGTGFNFSRIRPRGDFVRSSGGVASGPISFMSMIDFSCGEIKQGGTRRGANMGILNVDHPDILEFLTCKTEDGRISNFNISVGITDAFMQAVKQGDEYDLINPRTGDVYHDPSGNPQRLPARDVWEKLVEGAWLNGEPGMIFLDRLERTNPTPDVALQDTTNPCGEQPLLPYEACVLGSINLNWHLNNEHTEIDWDALRRDVHLSVRFLDDMVEASNFPLEEIDAIVKHGNRRVGLGVMGWADMLFSLKIAYDSPEAESLGKQVMEFINSEACRASEELAAARGAFPNFKGSAWDRKGDRERRNATVTTIAPTGTISMIADASSGIEPLFALIFWKNVMRDGDDNAATSLRYVNPLFEQYARDQGFFSDDLVDAIEENHGSLRITEATPDQARKVLEHIPDAASKIFVTAHDVSPEWHIRVQSSFQAHTENAVSKTINFPHEASRADVDAGYWMAYEAGCKGVTVYRDGSRDLQVLTTSNSGDSTRRESNETPQEHREEVAVPTNGSAAASTADMNGAAINGHAESTEDPLAINAENEELTRNDVAYADRDNLPVAPAVERKRPDLVHGTTTRIRTGCGPLFVTINEDDQGQPFETFAALGKAGGCAAAQTEAIGRLASLALRSGVPADQVQEHLRGITCHRPAGFGENRVHSCGDGIAQALSMQFNIQNTDFVPMVDLQGEGTYAPPQETPVAAATPVPTNGSSSNGASPQAAYVEGSAGDQAFVGACPDCHGHQLSYAEGCVKCLSPGCGYSECG